MSKRNQAVEKAAINLKTKTEKNPKNQKQPLSYYRKIVKKQNKKWRHNFLLLLYSFKQVKYLWRKKC